MWCKHCGTQLTSAAKEHYCRKKGLLKVDEDDSFLISAAIGYAPGSTLLGGILGGDLLGAGLGDMLEGDGLIDDDDW